MLSCRVLEVHLPASVFNEGLGALLFTTILATICLELIRIVSCKVHFAYLPVCHLIIVEVILLVYLIIRTLFIRFLMI